MATTKKAPAAKATPAEGMRRCIGSAKFGIAPHDAPIGDFPVQPSQEDGYGRMCRPHWTEYTRALRKAATPPKPAPASVAEVERAHADKAEAKVTRTAKAKPAAKPATSRSGKPSRKAAEAAVADATVRAEASANPDPDAAEQDAILAERKTRVKNWRRQEAEKALAGS